MSLRILIESILRRIMRVACVVGALGTMFIVLARPIPVNWTVMSVALVALGIVFGVTFFPIRVRILSFLFPWALVTVGVTEAAFMGPRPGAALLLAAGVVVASLVMRTGGLLLVGGTSVAVPAVGLLVTSAPVSEVEAELWFSSLTTMLAVILPCAIAGRMVVGALARALGDREALIEKVSNERRVLEETVRTLETTRTQLTHAQKLELVSQLAGGIAHDMNNALTAVIGEASLLDDNVAEERERILEAGSHAAKLTQQLMLFGRRDTSRPRPIDLVATLRHFEQSVRRLMPSDIVVSTELPGDGPAIVVADPTQILQILLNLAGNARDAMQTGGHFWIRVHRDDARNEVRVEIADDGPGIAPENLAKVFDPFFTTKPAGKGTGLGLASVKQLVEALGGTVRVTSHPGRGARFLICLPLSDGPVESEKRHFARPRSRTGTILVVDDDVRARAVAFTALERAGYRVFEAASVKGAAEVARTHRNVDLVVTDVVLPGGGGAEVVRQVRAVVPGARVLVMSGYADDETLRRGIAQGEHPFLPKPFTAEELVLAVDRSLARDPL